MAEAVDDDRENGVATARVAERADREELRVTEAADDGALAAKGVSEAISGSCEAAQVNDQPHKQPSQVYWLC